jgi:hypothetical protein
MADRMEPFIASVAMSLQEERLQECLEMLLFHCGEFALDREFTDIVTIVARERARYPQYVLAFHEECVQRVPVALAMWLKMQCERGALIVDNPGASANVLVNVMTSEQGLLGISAETFASVTECRERARLSAEQFIRHHAPSAVTSKRIAQLSE